MLRTFREDKLFRLATLLDLYGIVMALVMVFATQATPHTETKLQPVKQQALTITASTVTPIGTDNTAWEIYFIITRPNGSAESGRAIANKQVKPGEVLTVFQRRDTNEASTERWPDELITAYTVTGQISRTIPWMLLVVGALAALTSLWFLWRQWTRIRLELSVDSMPIEKRLRSEN